MNIKPIRTDADRKAALAEIEHLWQAPPGSPEGARFVDLGDLGTRSQKLGPMRYVVSLTGLVIGCLVCLSCSRSADRPSGGASDVSSRIAQLLERYQELDRFSGSFAMSVDGELLFAGGYGESDRAKGTPISAATKLDLASLTKQFTAAAILKLEADGKLRVADRVADHLPDYPRPQADQITLHHLLSHTSGIPSLWRLGDGLEGIEASAEPIALADLLALFQDRDLLFEPGERYRYSNSGYVVLAAVIESASGKSFAEVLRQALFLPLGMNDTGCHDTAERALPYFGYPPEIERAEPVFRSWSGGHGGAHSSPLGRV